MSAENVKKFMQIAVQDKALQLELSKAGTDVAKLIALGKARGLDFTAQDIKTVYDETGGELSEEQLEKVAGGFVTTTLAVVVSVVSAAVAAAAAVGSMVVEAVTAAGN